jgi:hypothetical protein
MNLGPHRVDCLVDISTLAAGMVYTFGMSDTIPAVYRAGAFHPLQPVDLPDGARAEVIPLGPGSQSSAPAQEPVASWPSGYFEQTAGALAGETLERPRS